MTQIDMRDARAADWSHEIGEGEAMEEVGMRQMPHDLLAGYSLEMTAKDRDSLTEAHPTIPSGTQISVTFLPGEEVDARVAAAATVRQLGFEPMLHVSARRLGSQQELQHFLGRLSSEAGIDRAFIVAGDPNESLGPYEDALAVIKSGLLARYGVRTVGISGYPEGHPDISDAKLWIALLEKRKILVELGHDFEIITQFGFDSEPFLAWIKRVRDAGIAERIKVGVPGPASVKTLLRFAARCGVGASARVMAKYGVSITKLLNTAGPDRLLDEFRAGLDPAVHGDVRFHFYPFGGFERTADWVHKCRSD